MAASAPIEGTAPAAPRKKRKKRGKKPPPRLSIRLLLAAFSLLFTLLTLEVMTRLLVPPPAPTALRKGVYVNMLAKVNGFESGVSVAGVELEEAKRPGEVRVAVFGESTVQGTPWGGFGSPVAMLYDQLHDTMPDKDITVLNMGRGAGYTIDAYYFLVSILRFAPDYVVFFQGANDTFNIEREMCMPSEHPLVHRAWRFGVEHSRFLWSVRALGPALIKPLKYERTGGALISDTGDRCDGIAGFKAWTDLLVETAQRAGAKVIVTTAVSNPLRWPEKGQYNRDRPLAFDQQDEPYRRLLACVLDAGSPSKPGCDIAAAFEEQNQPPVADEDDDVKSWFRCRFSQRCGSRRYSFVGPDLEAARFPPILWLLPRVDISLRSAQEHGARGIDFNAYLANHMKRGLRPLVFVDEMHMTLPGLWELSWRWTIEIANLMDGRALPEAAPPFDEGRYLPRITRRQSLPCIYLSTVPIFLRTNMPLVGAVQLRLAVEAEAGKPKTRPGLMAELVSGWLRRKIGVEPGLSPELAAGLDGVDIEQFAAEIAQHADCSTVGGAFLDSVVPRGGAAAP